MLARFDLLWFNSFSVKLKGLYVKEARTHTQHEQASAHECISVCVRVCPCVGGWVGEIYVTVPYLLPFNIFPFISVRMEILIK